MTATRSLAPTTVPTSLTAPSKKPRRRYGRRRVWSRKQRWLFGTLNLTIFFIVWQIAARVDATSPAGRRACS